MGPLTQNFTMVTGDTKILNVSIKDPAGKVVNILGYSIIWALKTSVGNSSTLIKKTIYDGISVTNGAGGIFQIRLESSDTEGMKPAVYYHECEITDSAGNISTVFTGRVSLIEDGIWHRG